MVGAALRRPRNARRSFPMTSAAVRSLRWRTPAVIVACGCLIAILSYGPRASLGFFLAPLTQAHGWGRDVFSLALALQMLMWGVGQPFAGAIADRYGTARVLCAGAVLYAVGLVMMAHVTTPGMLDLAAGFFIGFGLAGSSFTLVLAALGKLLPPQWRTLAFGAGTAAGSFGQFLYSPMAVFLIDGVGWQTTLIVFAAAMMLILPLSIALMTPPATHAAAAGAAPPQALRDAIAEALRNRSYLLLVLGFFTCGFQLQFITIHMPAFLIDRGMTAEVGGWTLGVIGLFNIVGSLGSGWLASFLPKRYILSAIYFLRALAVLAFISFPVTPVTCMLFGAMIGLLWLSTVPPTNGIVAVIFGTRWLAMLTGFAFFSHQVGGFLGVWLGGFVFERTGSYDLLWWLSILFGVLSALINMPIVEKPAVRTAAAVG
jgi:MFS family permease